MNKEEIKQRESECNYEIETLQNQIETLGNELKNLENLKQYPIVKGFTYNYGKGLQLILFTAPYTGVNINGVGHPMGNSSEKWDEPDSKPFTGILTYKDGLFISMESKP